MFAYIQSMRIITNPFFGAGKKARDLYFVNQDISVFLTTASFSQKLTANKIIYTRTAFQHSIWDNAILVKDFSLKKVNGKPLFLEKHRLGRMTHNPQGEFVVMLKVVKHIVVGAARVVRGVVVDAYGEKNLSQGISFPTLAGQISYYSLLLDRTFTPDIVLEDTTTEPPAHLTKAEQKTLDAHYTPAELANIMAGYLVGDGPLLDPFCGKGALLEAALNQGKVKEQEMYGWDIDPVAIEYCRKKFPKGTFEVADSLKET